MNNTTVKWMVGVGILIIIAIAAYALMGNQTATAPTQSEQAAGVPEQQNPVDAAVDTVTGDTASITVRFTETGFTPSSVTVKAGQSVTFVNETEQPMWVASAQHPTHMAYDGNNLSTHCAEGYTGPEPFDQCASAGKGGSFTFAFTKTGEWKYHNHVGSGQFGTVVVE